MGHRRTDDELRRDRAVVASLYLKGHTQRDIAQHLDEERDYDYYRQKVNNDLKQIRKRWEQSALMDFHQRRAEEIARIDQLEREYWEAWEASKEEQEEYTRKVEPDEDGDMTEAYRKQTVKDGEAGDASYLKGVQWCIDKRCEILGLDAPDRTMNLNVDWDSLSEDQLQRIVDGEEVHEVIDDAQAGGGLLEA